MVTVDPKCIEYGKFTINKEYKIFEEDYGEFREGAEFPPIVTEKTLSYLLEDDTEEKMWVDSTCCKLVK
ncbi:MAG TPA: hypothetical protein DCO75_06250 [Fibrobacteres bacterium]|jgi:hypothetical protein|nr:hypothetical protein [Fibrobacterota bacterium]